MLKFLKWVVIILFFIVLVLYIWGRFYENRYRLLCFLGKKGSGKTTISAKLSIKHQRKGYPVFSDHALFGAYKLDTEWLGRYDFPENSLIIVDEGMISFDNRKFATFSDAMRNFFVMQRHDKVSVIILCQDFLLDRKVRSLTDSIYVCVNFFNVLCIAKKVHKGIALATDNEGQGSIGEQYTWEFPLSWMIVFIPRWVQFFDSFRKDEKPKVEKIPYEFKDPDRLLSMMSNRFWMYDVIRRVCHFLSNEIRTHHVSDRFFREMVIEEEGIGSFEDC